MAIDADRTWLHVVPEEFSYPKPKIRVWFGPGEAYWTGGPTLNEVPRSPDVFIEPTEAIESSAIRSLAHGGDNDQVIQVLFYNHFVVAKTHHKYFKKYAPAHFQFQMLNYGDWLLTWCVPDPRPRSILLFGDDRIKTVNNGGGERFRHLVEQLAVDEDARDALIAAHVSGIPSAVNKVFKAIQARPRLAEAVYLPLVKR